MLHAPIALLEESLEQRVKTILHDYIISNYLDFKHTAPDDYQAQFADYLLGSLNKIQRRLGTDNYHLLRASMEHALSLPETDLEAHGEWIRLLLQKYYDPMYDYQLNKKLSRVVFRGSRDELLRWAAHLDSTAQASRA